MVKKKKKKCPGGLIERRNLGKWLPSLFSLCSPLPFALYFLLIWPRKLIPDNLTCSNTALYSYLRKHTQLLLKGYVGNIAFNYYLKNDSINILNMCLNTLCAFTLPLFFHLLFLSLFSFIHFWECTICCPSIYSFFSSISNTSNAAIRILFSLVCLLVWLECLTLRKFLTILCRFIS